VGNIYKTKKDKVFLGHENSEILGINKGLIWYLPNPARFSYEYSEYYPYEVVKIDKFWQQHEEIPDSNLQETEEVKAEETVISLEKGLAWLKEQSVFIKERSCDYETKFETLLIALDSFFGMFKGDETPNSVDLEKIEVSEVEKALEELKNQIKYSTPTNSDYKFKYPKDLRCSHLEYEKIIYASDLSWVIAKAKNLINALEPEKKPTMQDTINLLCNIWGKEDMSKPEPKIDMKEERVEPVSIFRHISSLSKEEYETCDVVMGNYILYKKDSLEFIQMQDLLSIIEQMQKDIEELKKCQK
jgi:hypothetical protein